MFRFETAGDRTIGEEEVVAVVKKEGSIDAKVEGRSREGTFHGDGSCLIRL